MGASMLPFGDLSGCGEAIDAKAAFFLFSNSIVSPSKLSSSHCRSRSGRVPLPMGKLKVGWDQTGPLGPTEI